MRVLVADTMPGSFAADAEAVGWNVTVMAELTTPRLPEFIAGFDALIVRSTEVTGAVVDAADRLALIVRAGAGTNTIDVEAASGAAIIVSNVPGRNAIAVAELTMALLVAIDRNIPDNVARLRDGKWDKRRFSRARGLHGRTIGIVGLGSIGREVAERVAAFGMPIVSIRRPDPSPEARELIRRLRIELVDDVLQLAEVSDVVSFHVPLNESTRDMIDAEFLAHMRDGAVLLNTSRGELVADESDLLAAIDAKGLRLGVDVYRDEPGSSTADFASALAQHRNVYGTHHIGASTEQAQEAVAAGVVEVLAAHLRGIARNAVNLLEVTGTATLVVRHLNRVGVLSAILSELRQAGINIENMENRIFAGEVGAIARLALSELPPAETQTAIGALPNVIDLVASRP